MRKEEFKRAFYIPIAVIFITIGAVILTAIYPILEDSFNTLQNVKTNNTVIIVMRPVLPWLFGLIFIAIILALVVSYIKIIKPLG